MMTDKDYKTEIGPVTLPCGTSMVAREGILSRKYWGLHVDNSVLPPTERLIVIRVDSIPDIIDLLKEMYNNSPIKFRKEGVDILK